MLYPRFNEAWLSPHLVSREDFHPYPTCAEREAWDALPAAQREAQIARGEKMLDEAYPSLPATLYLEYARNGNRSRYEAHYFKRRTILSGLVLAECVEGEGRFLDKIIDGIWCIAEETSWCIPAHINAQEAGVGLPDVNEQIVDLFAAETGATMAWALYLLGEQLDETSLLVRARLADEIDERILIPAKENDHWWMGFWGGEPNNWNPWICSNWLICLLTVEEDISRRRQSVSRILRALDNFIMGYPDDGACDEGPGYWGRAGASLFDCLELLHQATRGELDVFGEPLIRNMGTYIYGAQLAGEWGLNFADAGARGLAQGASVFRFGRAIKDEPMTRFAVRNGVGAIGIGGCAGLGRGLPCFLALPEMRNTEPLAPLPREVWWDGREMLVARDQEGSTDGLLLAAKGGNNQESHNHNDVGQFMVYHNGNPMLIDIGVEAYTAKTFSSERYTIWTMQSGWHNLPTVNGVMQTSGREQAAGDVICEISDEAVALSLDIAGAYAEEAGLASWQRTLTLTRGEAVSILDAPSFTTPPTSLTFSLVTPSTVTIDSGTLRLSSVELPNDQKSADGLIEFDAGRLTATVETQKVEDEKLQAVWGKALQRITLTAKNPASEEPYAMRVVGV